MVFFVNTWLSVYTFICYGILRYTWQLCCNLPGINFIKSPDNNIAFQATLAAIFPETMPYFFFSLYCFCYRVEITYNILNKNYIIKKNVVLVINQWRRSPFPIKALLGRTGAYGIMGGIPPLPGGNPRGALYWGVVVLGGIALNQTRLHLKDRMKADNERARDTASAANERTRNTANAANERAAANCAANNERIRDAANAKLRLYEVELKAYNDRPWWNKGDKPKPPTL